MNPHSTLPGLKNSRCLVCALLSARVKDPEQILGSMEMAVQAAGGINVGRLLQRRGASRSDRRGGTKRMDQPLTQRTLFGSGKLKELIDLVEEAEARSLMIYNSISVGQRKALAEATGCRVFSFLDDVASLLPSSAMESIALMVRQVP